MNSFAVKTRSVAMRRRLLCSESSVVGVFLLCGLAACSSNGSKPSTDSGQPDSDSGAACKEMSLDKTYVLIDDMETTDHGPIQPLKGIDSPLSPGYWYNSGASYSDDAGAPSDKSN